MAWRKMGNMGNMEKVVMTREHFIVLYACLQDSAAEDALRRHMIIDQLSVGGVP